MLWTVLLAALDAAYESDGIYDPTVLHSLERAGYDRSFEAIEASGHTEETDSPPVRTFGSWRRIRMDDAARSVVLPGDLALDLGGIAKGWTVDHVALALAPLGPVLVDAGGDLRVVGTVDGELWPIGVQEPVHAGTRPRPCATALRCARDEQYRRTPVAARRPDAASRDRPENRHVRGQ